MQRRAFKFDIAMGVAILISATVIAIMGYTYHTGSKTTRDISYKLMAAVAESVNLKTTQYLKTIERLVHSVSVGDACRSDARLVNNEHLRETLATSIIQSPQLKMLYFGDETGSFVMAMRRSDGHVSLQTIDRTVSPTKGRWIHKGLAEDDRVDEMKGKVVYDPRARPWYSGAAKVDRVYWSDMYVFFTDDILDPVTGKPAFGENVVGITASYPVHDDSGKMLGVIGADITMRDLNSFLSRLTIGNTGVAFVMTAQGEIVAHPDDAMMGASSDGKARLMYVGDLPDCALRSICDGVSERREDVGALESRSPELSHSFLTVSAVLW